MTYLEIVMRERPELRKFDIMRSNCPCDFQSSWPSADDEDCDMECHQCWKQEEK